MEFDPNEFVLPLIVLYFISYYLILLFTIMRWNYDVHHVSKNVVLIFGFSKGFI